MLRSICYVMLYLACTVQNILVLIIEAKHAGAILPQCFEDVKMAVSGSEVKRSAFLNTYLVVNSFDQERFHLVIWSINTCRRPRCI